MKIRNRKSTAGIAGTPLAHWVALARKRASNVNPSSAGRAEMLTAWDEGGAICRTGLLPPRSTRRRFCWGHPDRRCATTSSPRSKASATVRSPQALPVKRWRSSIPARA